uniref:Gamma-tubulin complex component 6 n=1 Tax=Catharus ustulatus TaxID=91951 RepID=A0A8C3Y0F5_CATUS
MESITQLFSDLCEAHLTSLPWKVHLGRQKISKRRAKQNLKRVAYNALFMNLFQDEARKLQSNVSRLPVKNKILMLSFNLRVAGLGAQADRLENLVEELETAECLPFTEVNSVLDLLVQLAGTGPPQLVPQKKDYFLNNKYVGRNVKYQGYDYYDVSVFEADIQSLITNEECQFNDTIQQTLQIMEAAPGTGLPAIGLFSQSCPAGDKFEKETRVSLFGALVHSRTYDMDIKLDLPPVPDNADLSGLAIKVPQSIDQSEDEGFQSASNLTPDSQSEPSITPDIDLWDAVLTYGPSKRRCWERIGYPPGKKEEPYLTEAGREAFDKFYKLREGELQLFTNTVLQLPQLVLVKEPELVKDVLNVLIGVVSTTFSLNQAAQSFVIKEGIYVSGTSPETMHNLLSEVAEYGTYYTRLSRFSLQPVLDSSYSKGLVFQAFTSGLRKYLQYYRACVLSTPPTLSLLTISFLFRKLGRQLRYLAELCGIGTTALGISGGAGASFPTGVKLLSYLYKEALNNCSNEHYPVLLSLLKTSCEPYTRFIYDWVYSGVFRDVYGEFMIQVNEDYLCFRDKHYWTHGYVLISKEVEDCVPVFLKHIANDVYICGKTINLLKLCCPRHYICWSDIPVPRISVIFSLEELKEIERDCAVYVGRMERIARYSSISKEEKDLRMEIAKQELIVHARETASKVLKAISDKQISERMALDAKKREQFQKLKEQFAKEQERRLAIKQEEIDDDFSYARELREREKRLKALEEELEKKASKLSDDAARREQRTLWKMQRHKLETARLKFLLEDQKRIELALDKSDVSFAPLHSNETVDRKEPEPEQGYATSADKALPTPEPEDNNADEHFQPKATGSESNLQNSEKACSSLYNAESLPESNVNIEDFLSKSQDEKSVAVRMQGSLLDEAFRNINSDLSETLHESESQPVLRGPPEEDNAPLHQQSEYDFNTVLRSSAAWQGHVGVGENVFDVDNRRPRWNIHGHASDSNIRVGEYVPQVDTYQPHPSPYGHSSDSHIKSNSYTSEVEPRRPRWNIHGHVSEAHIKIGEYASETETSRPRWNIHGHASEANIKIGEYVSNVAPARPRWSSHGHASDANIKIGENVSDVVSARPRWNIHGHASQSHIKIGELVSDTEPLKSRWSPFGHASQSSIQIGKWAPSTENDPIPHRKIISGSSSDSTVQTLLYSEELPPAEGSRKEAKPSQREEPEKALPQYAVPQETLSSEANAPTTKEEDGEEEDTWKKEQAYLKALSDQYCIEKYQDSYDLMSEPPVSHLLHHVIPRSYTFPVDPMVQSATDETAVQLSELLSLPVLMKRSITAPLVSHVSLVNKAIVDYYFVELNVEKHFEALRHFLLMEDGEFAQSLSDLLFEKLGSGQTPGELLNPLVLNSILNKALQYSLHGDTQLASNLSFALKYLPEMFKPNAPDALSCLELRYKVDWPLNIVITESCMNKYNKIFSFLLQLKHMVWTLKDVWFHLKRTALVSRASNSVQFRQLQLYKHEMQHFVKVIQGYIANQILHVTWCEFGNKLSSVGNLEEIHRTHAEYLNKAIFRGLLTEKAAPVMNIIHSIFSLILKFRSQLISQSWSFDAGKQMAVHPNFGLMQQSYNTFKYYSHFLFKVVTKLVNRGYQPHLEDFLLRINFNNYYKDN